MKTYEIRLTCQDCDYDRAWCCYTYNMKRFKERFESAQKVYEVDKTNKEQNHTVSETIQVVSTLI